MQHQLIDIFLYDGLQPSSAPIYQSGYGCMKDILVMREDSSCYCDLLYQEGGGNSSIPLFPMGEKWKLNVFLLTKYSGYDPEIGGTVLGIDRGVYPQARSFMLGLNVGF